MDKIISFTGHRPDKLFGTYEINNPNAKKLAVNLTNLLEKLILEKGANKFISGGALGVDQIAFICVHKLKEKYPHIKNILAIPFKDQPSNWKGKKDKERYEKMLKIADQVVYVDELQKYKMKSDDIKIGEYHVAKMQLRNEFMVDKSHIVISVWDRTKGGTHNCVRYAKKEKKIILNLNPNQDFKLEKISY